MTSIMAQVARLYIWWADFKKMNGSAKLTEDTIRNAHLYPAPYAPPANLGVSISRVDYDSWPVYRISKSADATNAIVYVHGGAWFREMQPRHWKFVASIALSTGYDVYIPIYPLLPRPCANAKSVVMEVARLFEIVASTVPNVTLMGDSAGGTIALAVSLHLLAKAKRSSPIQSLVLIAPVLDLNLSHPEIPKVEPNDPWLNTPGLGYAAHKWAGDLSLDDPLVSPLFGDFSKLPPTLLLCGTDDILVVDARRMAAKISGQHHSHCLPGSARIGTFEYIEKERMIHVYPIQASPEGQEAVKQISDFLRKAAIHE